MRKILFLFMCVLFYVAGQSQTMVSNFPLQGNFTDALGKATCTENGNNATMVFEPTGGWSWTATAPTGGGLIIKVPDALIDEKNYSLVIDFEFKEVNGYRKIIDFKDRTADEGFYFKDSKIVLFPNTIGTNTYLANTRYKFGITREASTNLFKVYSFNDAGTPTLIYSVANTSLSSVPALVGSERVFRLFTDDITTSAEFTTGGTVYSVGIWDGVITTAAMKTFLPKAPSYPGGVKNKLAIWLDANRGVEATDGQVTQWIDQSGAGLVVTEATTITGASTATIVDNAATVNYNKTITFVGGSASMGGKSSYSFSDNPLTIFSVAKDNGTAGYSGIFATHDNTGENLTGFGPGLTYAPNSYNIDANGAPFASTSSYTKKINIIRAVYTNGGTPVGGSTWMNGSQEGSCASSPFTTTPGNDFYFEIGGRTGSGKDLFNPGRIFKGDISEVITYNGALSDIEANKIESYLAIKYGITKAGDYTLSDGTKVWDATANATYHNSVFGVARDVTSGLQQSSSKCIDTGWLTIEYPGLITTDKTAFIVGDNNGTIGFSQVVGNLNTMQRVWKVTETGGVGTLSFSQGFNARYLLVSNSADFTNATKYKVVLNSVSANIENGQYFTFATEPVVAYYANLFTPTSFNAVWSNAVWGTVTSYMLDVATDEAFTSFVPGYQGLSVVGGTSQTVTVNTPATTPYYFRVRAVTEAGTSANSNIVSTVVPVPIAITATNITTSSFDANWNKINGGINYLIEVATDAAFTNKDIGYVGNSFSDVSTGKVLAMSPGTTYYYRVKAATLGSSWSDYSNVIAVTTLASPITISPVNTQQYAVGSGAKVVDANTQIANGVNYNTGYIKFNITSATATENLSFTSDLAPNTRGAISFVGTEVLVGTGSGTRKIGHVSPTDNGLAGKSLKIDLTTVENGSFENGNLNGWTIINDDVILPGDQPRGWKTISSALVSNRRSEGDFSLQLYIDRQTPGCGVAHGPMATSAVMQVAAGDIISVDWAANKGEDKFDVYAYIVETTTGNETKVLYERGVSTDWKTLSIPSPYTGAVQLKFISGSQDATCGGVVSATLFIDNVRISSVVIPDAMVQRIAQQLTYSNSDASKVGTTRTLNIGLKNVDGATKSETRLIELTNSTLKNSADATSWIAVPKAIDPNLTVNSSLLTNALVYISSGLISNEDRLIYPANLHGVTGSYNQSTGILTLTGSATGAQYQEILRTIQYNNTNPNYIASSKTISFILGDALPFKPCGEPKPHFYKFINSPGITFSNAKIAAEAQTYFGMTGYLASISCSDENVFSSSAINMNGWIGASDAAIDGDWKWIAGPETGVSFWQGVANGSAVNGKYNNWNAGEPNNSGNSEHFAQFLPNGKWNDLSNSNGSISGYYLEFGGFEIDPVLKINDTKTLNLVVIKPSVQASDVKISNITSSSMKIDWTRGNGQKNTLLAFEGSTGIPVVVDAQTYTPNTVFKSGTQVGTSGWYDVLNETGKSVTVTGLKPETTYRFMVAEYNGNPGAEYYLSSTTEGNPVNGTTLASEPTIASSNISVTPVTPTTAVIKLTPGNGTKRVVCLIPDVTGVPTLMDGMAYTGSPDFANAPKVGESNWKVISPDATFPLNVTGLTPNTTYRVAVIDYNGTGGTANYLPLTPVEGSNPYNFKTPALEPTVQTQPLTIVSKTPNSAVVSWPNTIVAGNGEKKVLFLIDNTTGVASPIDQTTYVADPNFKNTPAGSWQPVSVGTNAPVTITGLTPDHEYRVCLVDFNGGAGFENYMPVTEMMGKNPINFKTLALEPTVQSSNVMVSNISTNTFTVGWTPGNGAKQAVFIKTGGLSSPSPVDGTSYTGNPAFGQGSGIGDSDWKTVFIGVGSSVDVSSLTPSTEYSIKVVDFNGSNGSENYLLADATGNPVLAKTLAPKPTLASTGLTVTNKKQDQLTVNWTKGNGEFQTVFVFKGNAGSPAPLNATAYTPNAQFAQGKQIGTSGWYPIFTGKGTTATVTGLDPQTEYRFAVVDFNGSDRDQNYLVPTGTTNPVNGITLAALPSVQASNIHLTFRDEVKVTANWTNGNGTKRAVFVNQTSAGMPEPLNAMLYNGKTPFKTGDKLGDSQWYCVYVGSGNSTDISSLTAGTNYRIAVLEYNGAENTANYLTDLAVNNPFNFHTIMNQTPVGPIKSSNVLTPDGDGKNDTWVIDRDDKDILDELQQYDLYIYNNIGEEIHHTKHYLNDWDGRYQGNDLPKGTYYYVFINETKVIYKGFITIIR